MIVGREKEIELLKGLLEEEESQFVAIYGRRRVGKTFLIREAFNYIALPFNIQVYMEPHSKSS